MADTGCVHREESRLETRMVLWQGRGVEAAAMVVRRKQRLAVGSHGQRWPLPIQFCTGMIISVIRSSDCEHGQWMGQQASVPALEAQG